MGATELCKVSTVTTEEAVVVRVAGDLDLASRDVVGEALRAATGSGRRLVVDMSATTFMDSSGLHVLLGVLDEQRRRGHDLVVRAPSEPVGRALEMAGLDRILTVEPHAS